MKGTLRQGGTATFDEMHAKSGHIGTLTGIFSLDRQRFAGAWRAMEGGKSMPVKLQAVAVYVLQQQKLPRISVTSAYPRFLAETPALKEISDHARESIAAQQQQFLQLASDNAKVLPQDIALSADYHVAIKYYSRHLLACWKRRSPSRAARIPTPPTSPIMRASTTARRNPSISPACSNPAPPVSASSRRIFSRVAPPRRGMGHQWSDYQPETGRPVHLFPASHHAHHRLCPLRRRPLCPGRILRARPLSPGLRPHQSKWSAGAVYDGSAVSQ